MDNLRIDYKILRTKADTMQAKVNQIEAALNNSELNMNKTRDYFQGVGADALLAKYADLKKVMPNFIDEMNKYIAFLRQTANEYEKLDNTIAQKAQNLAS